MMKVTTEQVNGIAVVRVNEPRLIFPMLSEFWSAVTPLIAAGQSELLIDLTSVTYVDSAAIGCLMDMYRRLHHAGGRLKLSGVQQRVETMLTITGAHKFIELYADESMALQAFR